MLEADYSVGTAYPQSPHWIENPADEAQVSQELPDGSELASPTYRVKIESVHLGGYFLDADAAPLDGTSFADIRFTDGGTDHFTVHWSADNRATVDSEETTADDGSRDFYLEITDTTDADGFRAQLRQNTGSTPAVDSWGSFMIVQYSPGVYNIQSISNPGYYLVATDDDMADGGGKVARWVETSDLTSEATQFRFTRLQTMCGGHFVSSCGDCSQDWCSQDCAWFEGAEGGPACVGLADAGVWRLADAGQGCAAACHLNDLMACAESAMTLKGPVLAAAVADGDLNGVVTCDTTDGAENGASPWKNADGACSLSLTSWSDFSCHAASDSSEQRLCWCVPQNPTELPRRGITCEASSTSDSVNTDCGKTLDASMTTFWAPVMEDNTDAFVRYSFSSEVTLNQVCLTMENTATENGITQLTVRFDDGPVAGGSEITIDPCGECTNMFEHRCIYYTGQVLHTRHINGCCL
jgi:hypothetical protein